MGVVNYPFGPLVAIPSTLNIYNIESFGADPTGVADSTSAIQTAVSMAGTVLNGAYGAAFVPPGTFRITSTVWVPSNVLLFGVDYAVSAIKADAAMANVSMIQCGPSVGVSYSNTLAGHGKHITVADLLFDGSALPGTANVYGVNVSYVDFYTIQACRFYSIPGYGTLVGANASSSSANNTLQGAQLYNVFDSCGGNSGADSSGGGNNTDEVFAFNYTTSARGTAADRVNPLRWTVAFNTSVSPNVFNGTAGFYKSDCGMVGGGFYYNNLEGGGGILVNGYLAAGAGLNGPPSDVEIIGNRINGSGGSGISLSAGNQSNAGTAVVLRCRVENNEILNPYNNAISLVDAQDCSISGGTAKDWNQAGAVSGSSQYAIGIGSNGINSQKNSYRGITFVSSTSSPKLYVETQLPSSTGLPYNNVLEDCTVDASGTPTVSLWSANLPQTIVRNINGMPPVSTGWSTPAVPSSGGSVTNQTPYDMWVILSGFTALNISLNGTQLSASTTAISFECKAGSKMTFTSYTGGAGTMVWAPV